MKGIVHGGVAFCAWLLLTTPAISGGNADYSIYTNWWAIAFRGRLAIGYRIRAFPRFHTSILRLLRKLAIPPSAQNHAISSWFFMT